MKRPSPLALLLGTVAILPPAFAQDTARRNVVEQKAALVQRVLANSTVVQRVRASGNDEALHILANAMANYLQAVAHAREGRLAEGEAAINDAMALIERARKLVPDAATRLAEQRARHTQLLQSTLGMLASARRHLERSKAPGEELARAQAEVAHANDLLASARLLATNERFEEANRALDTAEQTLLSALSRALGSATLDYTPRFESAAEEYRYEMERFASFRQLVTRARQEFKPAAGAAQQADRHVAQGLALHEEAERQAARGETGSALQTIREATEALKRALTATGLVVQTQQ